MTTDPEGFASQYLQVLGSGFHCASAPDGTPVLSTPFRFATGDPVEIALWEDSGRVVLSDRGGLVKALLVSGIDVVESDSHRAHLSHALAAHGSSLDGVSVLRRTEPGGAGHAVRALVQSVMDAQVAGHQAFGRVQVRPESRTYDAVRRILDTRDARFLEEAHVSGASRRRYPVDFKIAYRAEALATGVVIVARDRTLELAERWNFRFRDIHMARPSLRRLFVVDDDAGWSDDARRTIEPECEAVFPPGHVEELAGFLRAA